MLLLPPPLQVYSTTVTAVATAICEQHSERDTMHRRIILYVTDPAIWMMGARSYFAVPCAAAAYLAHVTKTHCRWESGICGVMISVSLGISRVLARMRDARLGSQDSGVRYIACRRIGSSVYVAGGDRGGSSSSRSSSDEEEEEEEMGRIVV